MTEYADMKVDPTLRSVMESAAKKHYGTDWRVISRAAHEAVIAWLLLVPDREHVDEALAEHGNDSLQELVEYLQAGRFERDERFDPLAAVQTPDKMADGGIVAGRDDVELCRSCGRYVDQETDRILTHREGCPNG